MTEKIGISQLKGFRVNVLKNIAFLTYQLSYLIEHEVETLSLWSQLFLAMSRLRSNHVKVQVPV